MKLIYVAGPYSAETPEKIQENINRAEQVSLKLLSFGWAVITPHKNTAGYEKYEPSFGFNYNTWINNDLELLQRCDCVYVIPGSEHSKGVMKEIEFAIKNNIPVFLNKIGLPSVNSLGCYRDVKTKHLDYLFLDKSWLRSDFLKAIIPNYKKQITKMIKYLKRNGIEAVRVKYFFDRSNLICGGFRKFGFDKNLNLYVDELGKGIFYL